MSYIGVIMSLIYFFVQDESPKTRRIIMRKRPISILPTISKILERITEEQLRRFIDFNDILPAVQSRFRKLYSCETTLLNITHDIITGIDISR